MGFACSTRDCFNKYFDRIMGKLIVLKTYWLALLSIVTFAACLGPPGSGTVALYTINTALDKRPVAVKIKDDASHLSLMAALSEFSRVSTFVYENTAYLAGYVVSRDEKERILDIVSQKEFEDVKFHFMLLSADSTSMTEDYTIQLAIKNAVLQDEELSLININVMSTGGLVVLVGKVKTDLQRRKADYLMRKIGLKEVHNYLVVSD